MGKRDEPTGTREQGSWAAGLLYFVAHGAEPRVLLLRRSEHVDFSSTWSAPGGFGRPGETPYEAACREAWEETGYRGGRQRATHVAAGKHVRAYHTFLMEVEQPFVPTLNHKNSDWDWFPLRALAAIELHPGFAASAEVFQMRIRSLVAGEDDGPIPAR